METVDPLITTTLLVRKGGKVVPREIHTTHMVRSMSQSLRFLVAL